MKNIYQKAEIVVIAGIFIFLVAGGFIEKKTFNNPLVHNFYLISNFLFLALGLYYLFRAGISVFSLVILSTTIVSLANLFNLLEYPGTETLTTISMAGLGVSGIIITVYGLHPSYRSNGGLYFVVAGISLLALLVFPLIEDPKVQKYANLSHFPIVATLGTVKLNENIEDGLSIPLKLATGYLLVQSLRIMVIMTIRLL